MNISQSDCGDLLTSEDVIQRLSIDLALRRMAVTCVLPAVRCGNEWRFRREDLDAWISKQRTSPASES
jgi:excisionase family DNA binding protein